MKKTKQRLKALGGLLFLAGVLIGILAPAFGHPMHSGMSAARREQMRQMKHLFELRYVSVGAALWGAGSALLVTGYALKDDASS